MPEFHLHIFVIEDCILYNLPDIKWDVLDNGIVEQGPLGRHFAQISHRDETRCDEVMPYLRNVGDECKTHLCFKFISHVILSILYPYSCKTHNISSKLGFARFFMESK